MGIRVSWDVEGARVEEGDELTWVDGLQLCACLGSARSMPMVLVSVTSSRRAVVPSVPL